MPQGYWEWFLRRIGFTEKADRIASERRGKRAEQADRPVKHIKDGPPPIFKTAAELQQELDDLREQNVIKRLETLETMLPPLVEELERQKALVQALIAKKNSDSDSDVRPLTETEIEEGEGPADGLVVLDEAV